MSFRLEVRLDPSDLAAQLRREARAGLTKDPKQLRSRWIWDARGSALYERIMELPEYYLPGAERMILEDHVDEIAAAAGPRAVVELGSGSSVKTRILLDALPRLERFVAVDVSENAFAEAGPRLAARYPHVEIVGIVADYERELPNLTAGTLLVFLGSTIGALEPGDRGALLASIAGALPADGTLMLGLDLVKPVERIMAAYNDAEGLSAALIANLLPVLNRELGANFDPGRFRSEARWSLELERMEMVVRSLEAQTVTLPAIDLSVEFEEGETLRTEISTKFRRAGATRELEAVGLAVEAWWTDEAGDFALCLARPVPEGRAAA
ncbi:MAG: L-histidine N(alpha)-methyltransferase [Gaiellaceae bacterium]